MQPVAGQADQRALQVFACRAVQSDRLAQAADHALVRQAAGIGFMRAVHDKGQRQDASAVDLGRQPAGQVCASQHFAAPEHAEFMFGTVARYAEGDASATAATVQSEYEPRVVPGAAIDAGIEVEAAVIAVHRGAGGLGVEDHRVPDERAVAEHPGVLAVAVRSRQPRERRCKRRFQRSLGQQRRRDGRITQGGAQPVLFEILSGDGHVASIEQSSRVVTQADGRWPGNRALRV